MAETKATPRPLNVLVGVTGSVATIKIGLITKLFKERGVRGGEGRRQSGAGSSCNKFAMLAGQRWGGHDGARAALFHPEGLAGGC